MDLVTSEGVTVGNGLIKGETFVYSLRKVGTLCVATQRLENVPCGRVVHDSENFPTVRLGQATLTIADSTRCFFVGDLKYRDHGNPSKT